MEKKLIRLTEKDLHNIVSNSVRRIVENQEDEGFFDRLKGMGRKMSADGKAQAERGAESMRNGFERGRDSARQMARNAKAGALRKGRQVRDYANDVAAAGQMESNKADARKAISIVQDLLRKGIIKQNMANIIIGNLRKYGNQ